MISICSGYLDATSHILITHAIGAGRRAAEAIHAVMMHTDYEPEKRPAIPYEWRKISDCDH